MAERTPDKQGYESVIEIIEQVCEDICDNYCMYRDTAESTPDTLRSVRKRVAA